MKTERWCAEERDTNSLGLESVDGLELSLNVVGDGLELGEDLLSLVNDVLVAKNLVVVGKVDFGGLLLELGELTLSVVGALAESGDLSEGVLAKTEVGDLGKIHCSSTSSHCVGRNVWVEEEEEEGVVGGEEKVMSGDGDDEDLRWRRNVEFQLDKPSVSDCVAALSRA